MIQPLLMLLLFTSQNRRAKCRKHENQIHKGKWSMFFTPSDLFIVRRFFNFLNEWFTPERRCSWNVESSKNSPTWSPLQEVFFISLVIRLSLKKYAICYFLCFPRAHSMPYFHHPCTHIFYLILFDFIIESHPQCFKKKRERKQIESNIY